MIKWIVQQYFANLNNVTLFQMIHFRFGQEKDDVLKGKDEDTVNLVTKLNHETQLESKMFEQERDERVKAATAKTNENSPP